MWEGKCRIAGMEDVGKWVEKEMGREVGKEVEEVGQEVCKEAGGGGGKEVGKEAGKVVGRGEGSWEVDLCDCGLCSEGLGLDSRNLWLGPGAPMSCAWLRLCR